MRCLIAREFRWLPVTAMQASSTVRGPCLVAMDVVRALVGLSELHGPGLLLAGVDLEKPSPVEPTGKAILGAANDEFLFAGTHESPSRPFPTTVVVNRIYIIETSRQRSSQQRLAIPRGEIPPALRGQPSAFPIRLLVMLQMRKSAAARGGLRLPAVMQASASMATFMGAPLSRLDQYCTKVIGRIGRSQPDSVGEVARRRPFLIMALSVVLAG